MKKLNKTFTLLLIVAFAFAPISPSSIFVFSQEEGEEEEQYEEITGYQEWEGNKQISSDVYIKPGAILVIKKGTNITFGERRNIIVEGKLFVKGTKEYPVKLRREGMEEAVEDIGMGYSGYSINVSGEAFLKNVDISGGGYIAYEVMNNRRFLNQAYAAVIGGVIRANNNAKLRVEECNFHGNISGVDLKYLGSRSDIRINRSSFSRNTEMDVSNIGQDPGAKIPDFKYNWWGTANGPEKTCYNSYCQYKKIAGTVNFSDWLDQEDFKDPVIIIPGIMGSEKKDGNWQIDPVFHTYDNLYEEFVANGYIPGKDLFTFPYEWRNSNIDNAFLLRDKISNIKSVEKWPKVDIIAHSMGGLLAREYIESDYYQDDVDQLITIGTPNNGAPEAYVKWEAGAFVLSPTDLYLKHKFSQEAKEKGYNDLFHYIQNKIPSVKELLPVYSYLYDVDNNDKLRDYPGNYPLNTFIESLNSESRKEKLLEVEMDKIIGNLKSDDESTITGFKVINANMGEYWIHGYPHGFEIPLIGDGGMISGYGDRTVPIKSSKSENIFADDLIEIDSTHRELPTYARKDILEILTGIRPENEIKHKLVKDILLFSVFSPIDIQVVAPDETRIGKNFETGEIYNEIEDAYYSGYSTDTEFITIPNPSNGEYEVLTQGKGDDEYRVEISKISENEENNNEASEITAEISGTAQVGIIEEKEVILAEGKITTEDEDNTLPTITGAVTTQPNADGWYNSDVTVHFTAEDQESGIDYVSEDIMLSDEGENQSVTGTAKDKAGNTSSITVSGINIDKTAPSINIKSPQSKEYLNNNILDISYKLTDNLTGMGNIETQISLDKAAVESSKIDTSLQNLGSHTLVVTALDKAGNSGESSVEYSISTNINAIYGNVRHYFSLGLIKTFRTEISLRAKIKVIGDFFGILKKVEKLPISPKTKKAISQKIKNQINIRIESLISDLLHNKQFQKDIDARGQELLIESLEKIKIN